MVTKTQAIQEFLQTQPCKVDLYTPEMEVQVNVVSGPTRVPGKSLRWTDGVEEWHPFRVPYNASGIHGDPTYQDSICDFTFKKHVEAVGLTGWDWYNRQSKWVGFDFDSIVNHVKGLSDTELDELRDRIENIDWITLRRSKSGKGLHLYVFLDPVIPTDDHREHAALARAILSHLSGLLNFDFNSKVDSVGGVLWIWHKEASDEKRSFQVLKRGISLTQVPKNWKDFLTKKKRVPDALSANEKEYQELIIKTKHIGLDDTHRQLLLWFAGRPSSFWWDAELNMLVCHTKELEIAHKELGYKGCFYTIASGKDLPNDYNCFAFPNREGSWTVRRFSLNCQEHAYWTNNNGWTTAYLNREPDLDLAARLYKGIKTAKGGYVFNNFKDLVKALQVLQLHIVAPETWAYRRGAITLGKSDTELVISVTSETGDSPSASWYLARGQKWEQVLTYHAPVELITPPDEIIRHAVLGEKASSWYLLSKGIWVHKDRADIKSALVALGYKKSDVDSVLGQAVLDPWAIVNQPFEPEYPGDRRWNKLGPQFSCNPKLGACPYWDMVIDHVSQGFHPSDDCIKCGILTGSQYLMLWIARLFQKPTQPLPYLFFVSNEQNTGKSIFHEGLGYLFKDQLGYVKANDALIEPKYNGELAGAILCVVEEIDLSTNKQAADKAKDWITGKYISIHPKGGTPYTTLNTLHWIQCGNNVAYCPILPGDTRISISYVPKFKGAEIPKEILLQYLKDETPYFLDKILRMPLGDTFGRLGIPVLNSGIKAQIEDSNRNQLEVFLANNCEYSDGAVISLALFADIFLSSLGYKEKFDWSSKRISNSLPMKYPTGRYGQGGQIHIGNIKVTGMDSKQISDRPLGRSQDGKLVTL